MKPPRTKLLGSIMGLAVYEVSGEWVRNERDIDFTQGGNEAVYPNYVPRGEIWIEDGLSPLDRTATVFHEIYERNMMMGKGWSYDRAHDAASAAERVFRRDLKRNPPKGTDLARVAIELARHPRPVSGNKHEREEARSLAVGRARARRRLDRELASAGLLPRRRP